LTGLSLHRQRLATTATTRISGFFKTSFVQQRVAGQCAWRRSKPKNMRPAFVIVIAVLLVALLAYDTYKYDGHYRAAAWQQAKQGVEQVEHQVDDLLEPRGH
jgi:cytochrome c-type biogenesis protein CcmH/NrfG